MAVVAMPMPSGLVSTSTSPGRSPALVRMRSGWTSPTTAMPYFGSGSSTVWPPAITKPASAAIDGSALEHVAEQLGGQLVDVPAHQVQREQRGAAHGVDVGHAVGGRDAAPGAGVVDHRGDEVGGEHQGALVREAPDGGVVAGQGPDQEVRITGRCYTTHDVRQLARGELARSAGAVRERREARRLGHRLAPYAARYRRRVAGAGPTRT